MRASDREFLISRIVSGTLRFHWNNRIYLLKYPSREDRYIADEIYQRTLYESFLENVYNDEEILELLIKDNLWDQKKEDRLKTVIETIDNVKVKLFQLSFRTNEQKRVRTELGLLKAELEQLQGTRSSCNHLSRHGLASLAKSRYLIGKSLHFLDSKPVIHDEASWKEHALLIEEAIEYYYKSHIYEESYRELARTEPWNSIWSASKHEKTLFGTPAVDLNNEQKTLITWSSLYERIHEHSECPAEDVIEDNDLLDGWMILQRKNSSKRSKQKQGEKLLQNKKIREAGEVYLVANNMEDAKRVAEMNDSEAEMIRKQRFSLLKKHKGGEVDELEMPDVKTRLTTTLTQHFQQAVKRINSA